jgi:hypothetical protein
MARVDAVIQQGPVNFKRGSFPTVLKQKYGAVRTARDKRHAEADLEAADVATYDQSSDATPDPAACNQRQETAEPDAGVAGDEAAPDLAACDQRQETAEADAYVAGEEALAAELNQVFEENQAAEAKQGPTIPIWRRIYPWDDYYEGGYDSDSDRCGCHSAFGKDDDGEVRHYGLDCQYRF